MAHPFEKMFEKALAKSSLSLNLVEKEARKLLAKGYRREEICAVLHKLENALIDNGEAGIVREAREDVCGDESETYE